MNRLDKLLNGDINKYEYLITDKKKYQSNKIICLILMMLFATPLMILKLGINYIAVLLLVMLYLMAWKIPYILLKLSHNEKCNGVMDAIPIWMNSLYSLIGENNIDNAIRLSYDTAPEALKSELKIFIEEIQKDSNNKELYIQFLSRYEIEGFKEIMMKLYEYRNLSKNSLRYEILTLNKSLGKIEEMKVIRRCKGELRFADTMASILITVPSLYLLLIQNVLSAIIM